MKKSMIFAAILAGSLVGGQVFASATTGGKESSIDVMAAISALGPVLKDVNALQKAYQDAVKSINAGSKAYNSAKNSAEKARGAIKIINHGLDPLSKLVNLFTSFSNAIVALNLSTKVSEPVKAKILPNLIKAQTTIKQMIDTMELLTLLIPEEKPAAVEEVQLEEAIFE